jgi:hypothetical protein
VPDWAVGAFYLLCGIAIAVAASWLLISLLFGPRPK